MDEPYSPPEIAVHSILVRGRAGIMIRKGDHKIRIKLDEARSIADQIHDIADLHESKGRA